MEDIVVDLTKIIKGLKLAAMLGISVAGGYLWQQQRAQEAIEMSLMGQIMSESSLFIRQLGVTEESTGVNIFDTRQYEYDTHSGTSSIRQGYYVILVDVPPKGPSVGDYVSGEYYSPSRRQNSVRYVPPIHTDYFYYGIQQEYGLFPHVVDRAYTPDRGSTRAPSENDIFRAQFAEATYVSRNNRIANNFLLALRAYHERSEQPGPR